MSLLLLLQGASAGAPSNDRDFSATWDQAAVTWAATAAGPGAGGRRHGGRRLMEGAAAVIGPAGERRQILSSHAAFLQAPAEWQAQADVNDDELVLAVLLGIH